MKRRISLEQAECIALKYLKSSLKKEFFLKKLKLEPKDLRIVRDILKHENEELYDRYVNNKKFEEKTDLEKRIKELNQIIDGIAFGIDGREFDLLDYFLITKYDFQTIIEVFNNSGRDIKERKLLIDFFKKYSKSIPSIYHYNDEKNPYSLNRDLALNSKIIINNEEVDNSLKLEAMKFLDDNNLPKYNKLYSIKLKRLLKEKMESQKVIVKQR